MSTLIATLRCVGCRRTEQRILPTDQPFCACGNVMVVEKVETKA